MITCPKCEGLAEITVNHSLSQDPINEEAAPCPRCGGTGKVEAEIEEESAALRATSETSSVEGEA